MLAPKRIKFRKTFKGRTKGVATRAASICRLEIHPGSRVMSPNSPKDTVLPRVAIPRVRPLNIFLNLTRFGASMPQAPVL